MCSGRRYGSNSSLSGSISIGDCRRPFVHIFHCGLIKPQNAGPAMKKDWQKKTHNNEREKINQMTNENIFIKIGLHNWQSKFIVRLNERSVCSSWKVWVISVKSLYEKKPGDSFRWGVQLMEMKSELITIVKWFKLKQKGEPAFGWLQK